MKRFLLPLLLVGTLAAAAAEPAPFDGHRAFADVKAQVDMGVRAPGTPGHEQCTAWIEQQMKAAGLKVSTQGFDVQPGTAPVHLTNVIGTLPGKGPDTIVVGAHYDTKPFKNITFVGADDGASGVGVLLELARDLAPGAPYQKSIQFVALDGEEAIDNEPIGVGLYGSTHFVRVARGEHRLARLKVFILLDMIGDANLDINTDTTSNLTLHDLVWLVARKQGVAQAFSGPPMEVLDDHTPFLQAGVPSLDLIDFQYGSAPGLNDYWHTDRDTLDKISEPSLQTVGRVVVAVVRQLASK